jgi:uncharacterized DUF497 family protein
MVDIVSIMPYTTSMEIFSWNTEKNEILARERGITFEEIVQRIESGAKVIETDHPNKKKYPNQKILIVDVDGYAYLVPCVIDKNEYFLETIIPSRKATKKYLGGKNG